MKNQIFPIGLALFLGHLCAFGQSAPLTSSSFGKPNIVFILVDDLGNGDLSCSKTQQERKAKGLPSLQTPALDTLAENGVLMTHHYSPAPVCAPSRASLLMGVHQGHANLRDNQFDKAISNQLTLASMLKSAGYSTALVGKWGISGPGQDPPAHPCKRGFDYYFGMMGHLSGHFHYPNSVRIKENRGDTTGVQEMNKDITFELDKAYSTDLFTAKAKDWLIQQKSQKSPFFLLLTYTAPHAQLDVPTGPYPENKGVTGGVKWLGLDENPQTLVINTAVGEPDSFIYPEFEQAKWDDDNDSTTPEKSWPDYAKRYATMVKRIDDGVEDIVQTLKDLNLYDNTVIVFTSDNGPAMEAGAKGKYRYLPEFFASYGPHDGIKRDLWEGGIRVPAIIHLPKGLKEKNLAQELSQFQDWMPTFAELAGAPIPAISDGLSLVPAMKGETRPESVVYSEYQFGGKTPQIGNFLSNHAQRRQGQMQMIRIGDFKGVRYNVKSHDDLFEIYNVVSDPQEKHDLAKERPDLQKAFHDEVLRRRVANSTAKRPYDDAPVPAITKPFIHGAVQRVQFGDFPYLVQINDDVKSVPYQNKFESKAQVVRIDGAITVPKDGKYTFYLTPGSEGLLKIHHASVVYSQGEMASGSFVLQAGQHPVTLYLRSKDQQKPLQSLEWEGPEIARKTLNFN